MLNNLYATYAHVYLFGFVKYRVKCKPMYLLLRRSIDIKQLNIL